MYNNKVILVWYVPSAQKLHQYIIDEKGKLNTDCEANHVVKLNMTDILSFSVCILCLELYCYKFYLLGSHLAHK